MNLVVANPFYTIGHSTRLIEDFVALLKNEHIELVVDIRTIPRSRSNPQYEQANLLRELEAVRLYYLHLSQLGGLRSKSKTIAPEINSLWKNTSFHNYADYALSEEFKQGLNELICLGHKQRTVIMCAESVWWRCHRRIVADYLLAHNEIVFHLMGPNRKELAQLTKGAIVLPNATVIYKGQ